MTTRAIRELVQEAVGDPVRRAAPLSGGCVGEVYRAELESGASVVAKVSPASGPSLEPEGFMLEYLGRVSRLPVPRVLYCTDRLLVMEHVETGGRLDADAQRHAADLLADLHSIEPDDGRHRFGLHRDTLIGPLRQPNPWTGSWVEFFRDHRLLYMGRLAAESGSLPSSVMRRITSLAARLGEFIEEPLRPSLIHGDAWGGNVLTAQGPDGRSRIAAFIDPAVYYADPEIELAFTTLFSTFGEPFFARYRELRPLPDEFFTVRRDLYNLYPLLVHTRLFGGGYAGQVSSILSRLGF